MTNSAKSPLGLIPFTSLFAELESPVFLGETPAGLRAVVGIKGGRFEGPEFAGIILPTGSDWNAYRPRDETMLFEARYELRTDCGVTIGLVNQGCGHVSPDVPMKLANHEPLGTGTFCVRTVTRFEAPFDSPYAWLNRSIFLGEVPFPDDTTLAVIHIYRVV